MPPRSAFRPPRIIDSSASARGSSDARSEVPVAYVRSDVAEGSGRGRARTRGRGSGGGLAGRKRPRIVDDDSDGDGQSESEGDGDLVEDDNGDEEDADEDELGSLQDFIDDGPDDDDGEDDDDNGDDNDETNRNRHVRSTQNNSSPEQPPAYSSERATQDPQDPDDDMDASSQTPTIPTPLLARLLHEHFTNKALRVENEAMALVSKYVETFAREAVARAVLEGEADQDVTVDEQDGNKAGKGREGRYLDVEDLEKLAPQLVLDF